LESRISSSASSTAAFFGLTEADVPATVVVALRERTLLVLRFHAGVSLYALLKGTAVRLLSGDKDGLVAAVTVVAEEMGLCSEDGPPSTGRWHAWRVRNLRATAVAPLSSGVGRY
jgi:hypothetical protein